jgi:hypothetical protein
VTREPAAAPGEGEARLRAGVLVACRRRGHPEQRLARRLYLRVDP